MMTMAIALEAIGVDVIIGSTVCAGVASLSTTIVCIVNILHGIVIGVIMTVELKLDWSVIDDLLPS